MGTFTAGGKVDGSFSGPGQLTRAGSHYCRAQALRLTHTAQLQGWFWNRFFCRVYGSRMWPRSPPSICLGTLQRKRTCEMHAHCCRFSLHVGMLCICLCVSVCKCIYAYVYPCEVWGGHQTVFITALLSPHHFQTESLCWTACPVCPGSLSPLSALQLVVALYRHPQLLRWFLVTELWSLACKASIFIVEPSLQTCILIIRSWLMWFGRLSSLWTAYWKMSIRQSNDSVAVNTMTGSEKQL